LTHQKDIFFVGEEFYPQSNACVTSLHLPSLATSKLYLDVQKQKNSKAKTIGSSRTSKGQNSQKAMLPRDSELHDREEADVVAEQVVLSPSLDI